jgi:hypothetical protein
MASKNLSFSGGLILGAGLVYLLHSERGRGPGAQCIAGALGFAAVAFGAGLIAKLGRESSTSTAIDIDAPDYAWLR